MLTIAGPMAFDYFKAAGEADDLRIDSAHERTYETLRSSLADCRGAAIAAAEAFSETHERHVFGLDLQRVKAEDKLDRCNAKLMEILEARTAISAVLDSAEGMVDP